MLHRSFKPAKCKTSLKLAVARLKLLKNKREVQVRQMKKDLAHLLETGQEKTAMIRVEHVVREEKTMAAYDFIDIYCELIVARLPIIESQKNCPIDLKEAVSSIMFAAPRCADIPELADVRKHFTAKYGKDFSTSALELRPNCGVNRTVVEYLSARAPDGQTKLKILTEVAKEHDVNWDPKAFGEKELKPPEDLLGPTESPVSHAPSYGQGSDSTNFQASNRTMHTPTQADASGGLAEGSKYTRLSSQNSNDFAPNRQNWNMDFKDATSAAHAAAESAEKASLAARAAAEFANAGLVAGQSSMGSHDPMMRDQQRYRNEREHDTRRNNNIPGVSDSMLESQDVTRKNSSSASSVSGASNIEGDLNRRHQYQRRSSSEIDFDNNGTQTKKPEKTNDPSSHPEFGSVNHPPHVKGSGHTNSFGEGVRRQLSGSSSSVSDDNGDVMSVSDLPKHGSDGGDNLYNSSSAKGNMQTGAKQPSFNSYSSAFFDEPVSEDETTEHQYGFRDPLPSANSASQVSENISPVRSRGGSPSYDDYSSVVFDEPVSDDTTTVHKYGVFDLSPGNNPISQFSEKQSTSKPGWGRDESSDQTSRSHSHLFTESSSPAEFAETINKTSSSQSAHPLPATFDDSDGIDSESEEETSNTNFSGRTESINQLHHHNSLIKSPESPKKTMPNFPEKEVKVVNRKPWLDASSDDSDFDSAEPKRHHAYSNVGTKSRTKNHELGDSFKVQSSSRHTKTADRVVGEREEETSNTNFSGRTESINQLHHHNSLIKSPESPKKTMPNFPEKEVKVVNRKPWLDSSSDDSDFDSAEPKRHHAYSNVGTKSRTKNHELGDSFKVQSSSRHTKTADRVVGEKESSSSLVSDEEQQTTRSSRYSLDQSFKRGSDSLALGSDEVQDGKELDLGRLRGGFRNKGYIRPPYRKQQQTDESNDGQLNVSSVVRTQTNIDTLNQDASKHSQQPRAPRESRSNNSRTAFESEDDETEVLPPQIAGSKGELGSKLSRRTRGSPASSDVSSPSAFTSHSRMEKFLDSDESSPKSIHARENHANSEISAKSAGSRRSSRTNLAAKQNPDPQPQSRYQGKVYTGESNMPVEHQPSKSTQQSQRPLRDDNLKVSQSSTVEDSSSRPHSSGTVDALKQSSLSKESVSRDNSLKKASHVHPKLPDYDSFAAHFQKIRSSR